MLGVFGQPNFDNTSKTIALYFQTVPRILPEKGAETIFLI